MDAQLQHALPDEFRGRAFALYDILYNVATVAAALVIFSADDFELRNVLVIAGAVTLVLAALLAMGLSRAGLLVSGRAD